MDLVNEVTIYFFTKPTSYIESIFTVRASVSSKHAIAPFPQRFSRPIWPSTARRCSNGASIASASARKMLNSFLIFMIFFPPILFFKIYNDI